MLTRRIDAAFHAIVQCRHRVPFLSEVYRPGTPERAAIDDLLNALQRADETLLLRKAAPLAGPPMLDTAQVRREG
jgi:hypothetical protein